MKKKPPIIVLGVFVFEIFCSTWLQKEANKTNTNGFFVFVEEKGPKLP